MQKKKKKTQKALFALNGGVGLWVLPKQNTGQASTLGTGDQGSLTVSGQVKLETLILVLMCLPFHIPGMIEPELGLAGPFSVYCDWVRYLV